MRLTKIFLAVGFFGICLPISALEAQKVFSLGAIFDKAGDALSHLKDRGEIRRVPKRVGHTVAFRGGKFLFDGRHLSLGGNMAIWKSTLGKGGECESKGIPPIVCKWEHLGIEIGSGSSDTDTVKFVTVHLQPPTDESLQRAARVGGGGEIPSYVIRGHFSGNLELEGFRIDQQTMFWEIRESVRQSMVLRCDVRDCQFPHAAFNDIADIYFILNGNTVRSTVNSISISADE